MPRLYLNVSAQKLVRQYKYQDDLTLPQYLEGYLGVFKAEKDTKVQKHMLAHLSDIAVLLQDFNWDTVREWSNSILTSVGQGKFTWDDHLKIEKEKMIKIMGASGTAARANIKNKNACLQFNAMKCSETESHGQLNQHICSFCLAAFNADHDHPVLVCQKKGSYRKHRGEQNRSDRYEKQDQNYQARFQGDNQQNQFGRGRGYYNQDNYNRPSYQPQVGNRIWNYPPPPPQLIRKTRCHRFDRFTPEIDRVFNPSAIGYWRLL